MRWGWRANFKKRGDDLATILFLIIQQQQQ
jgi:hypothetical protein